MIEQEIILELNKVIYKRQSLSFHLEEVNGLPTYCETFTALQLSPSEMFLLRDTVKESKLRRMQPIEFYTDDSEMPMIIMI